MKKVFIIVGIILIVLGVILAIVALLLRGNNLINNNNALYKTNTYTFEDNFKSIYIKTKDVNVTITNSDDNTFKAVCFEEEKYNSTFRVVEGMLICNYEDNRTWADKAKIKSDKQKMILYLPSSSYQKLILQGSTGDVYIDDLFVFDYLDIKISTGDIESYCKVNEKAAFETSTGNIKVKNTTFNNINLKVTTGKILCENVICTGKMQALVSTGYADVRNINCDSFNSTGTTGTIIMNNVNCDGIMNVERGTGNIEMDNCDANEIFFVTTTGHVKGNLKTEKIFITKTTTGKINVPESLSGGKCTITTKTGDIDITITK